MENISLPHSVRDVRFTIKSGHVRCKTPSPLRANSGHREPHPRQQKTQAFARGRQPSRPNAPRPVAMTQTKMNCALSVQCGSLDFLICSARATLQSTHIRIGSIGLVHSTHIGARHCAHWLMNEREIGINMSATSGHARTSADLSTGMH
jgi:hypothetical protein